MWQEGGSSRLAGEEKMGRPSPKREATPRLVALAWGWGLSACLALVAGRLCCASQSSLRTRQTTRRTEKRADHGRERQQCLELARMQASYGGRDETFAQFLVRPCCLLISSYKYF